MSDYRNPDFDPFDPNDPYRRGAKTKPELRPSNVVTGWVVAAVFVVAILAVIFGMTHRRLGTNTASNDIAFRNASPAMIHMAPPTPRGTSSPTPSPPAATKPPISPVPPAPGQTGGGQ